MAKQTISMKELNRIMVRGGKVTRRIAEEPSDELSELEEAAIRVAPRMAKPEPIIRPVETVAPEPVATPTLTLAKKPLQQPTDNSVVRAAMTSMKTGFLEQIDALKKKHADVVAALRSDMQNMSARKPGISWNHKIKRSANKLIEMIISWPVGSKVVVWTHTIVRDSPRSVIKAVDSSNGKVTIRHKIIRRDGHLDKIVAVPLDKKQETP